MRRCIHSLFILLVCLTSARGQVTDQAVATTTKALVASLLSEQKANGSWGYSKYTVGATSLCLFALLQAEVPRNHPAIVRASRYIVSNTDSMVYSESLVAVALEKLDSKRFNTRIRKACLYLETAQSASGGWSYTAGQRNSFDNSNTQFAALGLGAAKRAGIKVNPETIRKAIAHWHNVQSREGGWGYTRRGGTFSMTCAGVASLHVLGQKLAVRERTCGPYTYNKQMHAGLKWLIKNLPHQRFHSHKYYALYALERVAIFLGIKEFGGVDWYRLGASEILKIQPHRLNLPDKALALLFLAKGSAPIAIAKWQWSGDWNNQFNDVRNWCKYSGEELDQKLDWLPAPLNELDSPAAKASLLFITGTERFKITKQELEFLQAFLEEGGTVVAETSCNEDVFITSFKKELKKNLYQDLNPRWVPITNSHPVAWTKHDLKLADVAAQQYRVGCKKLNLLVLHRNISGPLNGDKDVQKDLDRAKKVATNLLAWSLQSRKAEKKLDSSRLKEPEERITLTQDQLKNKRASLTEQFSQPLGRIKHSGNWYAAPRYYNTLKQVLSLREDFPKLDGEVHISPNSGDLFNSAVVLITGYGDPRFRNNSLVNLRTYLSNGGTILVANACSTEEFDKGIRIALKKMLPNDKLELIPQSDDLYQVPFKLSKKKAKGTRAYTKKHSGRWAPLYGIRREGRWILVYSPVDMTSDISEGLHESIVGYKRESAAALSVNILHNALRP